MTCPVVKGFVEWITGPVEGYADSPSDLPWHVLVQRGYIVADFVAREIAPLVLEMRGRKEDAEHLRRLSPVTDQRTARNASETLKTAVPAAYESLRCFAAADSGQYRDGLIAGVRYASLACSLQAAYAPLDRLVVDDGAGHYGKVKAAALACLGKLVATRGYYWADVAQTG